MQEIDWEKIWLEQYEERERLQQRNNGIEDWDMAAEDFSFSHKTNNYEYGRKVKAALGEVLNSDSVVLEIGSGPGTLLIPFASTVKNVTAVEPSKGMIGELTKNAKEAGIGNYEVLNKVWEEIDDSAITWRYDLVVCSSVLWIFKDVWQQLRRMEQASKGYCCVVEGTGSEDYVDLWSKVMGANRPKFPDCRLIYNILYNHGRFANIAMITYISRKPMERWIKNRERVFAKYVEVTPDVKRVIREHVSEKSDGKDYRTEGQAGVIWWKADRGGRYE